MTQIHCIIDPGEGFDRCQLDEFSVAMTHDDLFLQVEGRRSIHNSQDVVNEPSDELQESSRSWISICFPNY